LQARRRWRRPSRTPNRRPWRPWRPRRPRRIPDFSVRPTPRWC